jgi:hypothetical protein
VARVKHILLFSLIAIFFEMVLEAKPSFAAFTTSDLQGTWRLHILTTLGEWIRGPLTIDGSGNYSFTTETSEGDSEETTGKVIISSNGIITMTDRPGLQGVMNTDKNFFVMTETWDFDFGVYEFVLFLDVKQGSGPFGPSDLAGTWYGHYLVSGLWNAWVRETNTIDSAGYSTTQWVDSDGNSETSDPRRGDMSNDGILTSSEWEPLQGVVSRSKNLIVLTNTRSEKECEMGIMMKEGGSFSSQDLTGTWYGHTLLVGNWKAWTRSTWNMDSTGYFQFAYENFDGSSGADSGTLDISNTGIITVRGDPNLQGVMNMDKNIIAWTQEWSGNVYALAVLVKSEKPKQAVQSPMKEPHCAPWPWQTVNTCSHAGMIWGHTILMSLWMETEKSPYMISALDWHHLRPCLARLRPCLMTLLWPVRLLAAQR